MADNYGLALSGVDPETSLEMQKLLRQQKVAEAMGMQAMQPMQGQMVGNVYVAPSITQGLAKLAQGYLSGQDRRMAEHGMTDLAGKQRQMIADEMAKVSGVVSGSPQQPMGPPTESGEMGVRNAVAPGSRQQIMDALTQSRLPAFQQAGLKMLTEVHKPETYKLGENEVLFGPGGKEIARGLPKQQTGKMGTEDVHIGGGNWQSFKVGADGQVDLKSPIGQPFQKRPTASSVSATANAALPKGDSKYAETRMADRAKSMGELDKSAEAAWKSNRSLDRFLEASKNGTQGGAQPIISGVQNFLSSFGYSAKDLKDTRQMEQAIGDILGSKMAELGARGLTDRDMDVLRQALPRVDTDRASRENVVGILKKVNNSQISEWENQRASEAEIYPDLSKRIPEPLWYKQYKTGGNATPAAPTAPPAGFTPL